VSTSARAQAPEAPGTEVEGASEHRIEHVMTDANGANIIDNLHGVL
jgi:hypothetical protein